MSPPLPPDSQRCSPDSYCSDLPLKEGTSWVCQIAVNILGIRNKVIWNVNFPPFCYSSLTLVCKSLNSQASATCEAACPGANKGQSCNAATWHRLADAPWFAQAAAPVGKRTLVYPRCSTGWQMHLGLPVLQHRLAYTLVNLCCNTGWHTHLGLSVLQHRLADAPGSPMQQHRLADALWFTCAAAPVGRHNLVNMHNDTDWHTHPG